MNLTKKSSVKVFMKSRDEYVLVDSTDTTIMELADRMVLKGHYNRRVFARAEYLRKTTLRGKIETAFRKLSYAVTGYHDYGITLGEALKWWDGEDFSEDYEAQLMKEERNNPKPESRGEVR